MRRMSLTVGLMALVFSAFALGGGAGGDARAGGHGQICDAVQNWADSAAGVAAGLDHYAGLVNPPEEANQRIIGILVALSEATDRLINAGGASAEVNLNFETISTGAQGAHSLLLPAVQAAREADLGADQARQTATGLRHDISVFLNWKVEAGC